MKRFEQQLPTTTAPIWGIGALALVLALLIGMPGARAQDGVNIKKAGEAAGQTIKEGAEGDSTARAAQEAQAESAGADAPEGATPPAEEAPAAGTAQPAATPASQVNPLDTFHRRKPTKEETQALMQQVFNYMTYHLDANVVDVRERQFEGGRYPWISRAPRQNPFDPQIVKPLPFHQLDLPTTPPPPYYPPEGGIKQQGLQDAFQRFLDSARLAGIVTIEGTPTAIVVFGKKTARMRIGEEFDQKEYTVRVKDITRDAVVVTTDDGSLSGILALSQGKNLFVGEGEDSLVIISGTDEETEN